MPPDAPKPTVLLLAAVGLALLADALFRGAAWGVNLGLWTLAVGATILALGRRTPLRLRSSARFFAIGVVGFALLFALRDSNALKIANGLALALCLGAVLLPPLNRPLRESNAGELLGGLFTGLGLIGSEAIALAGTTKELKVGSPESRGRNRAIGRGLLLALPILLVFGGLFASADPVFRQGFERLFRFEFDLAAFAPHLWTFVVGLVVAGGLLHRAFRYAGPKPPVVRPTPTPVSAAVDGPPLDPERERVFADAPVPSGSAAPTPGAVQFRANAGPKGLGITEIGIVLGSLALLFGGFLAVQFRYLFAGAETVRATAGLSYAEYARGGFFELVWVAVLAMVVILGAGASLRRERPSDDTVYHWLGRVLVAMVFLIVASAMLRMKLYTDAFGLTELRIYSSVFMVWLTLAFVWMLATTLAGRPRRFAFGSFVAGLATIAFANLLNPDRLIVRTNLLKPHADFAYLRTLGDDAVLALREMRGAIPAAHRAEAEALIARRRAALASGDWREANLARLSLAR